MKTNKYCCRIFPIVLLILSLIITALLWYFEEGNHSFSFLTDKDEIFNFLGTALFVFAIPIGIFYLSTERERLKNHAKKLALLGFLPPLILLLILI